MEMKKENNRSESGAHCVSGLCEIVLQVCKYTNIYCGSQPERNWRTLP